MENLNSTSPSLSTGKFSIPYGVVLGLIIAILAAGMYVSGMVDTGEQWPVYIYYLFFPFYIGYSVFEYRKKNNGFLSLKDAMKVGVSVALVGGIVYGIYNLIFMYVLEPGTVDKVLVIAEEKMREQSPTMTDDQVEEALKYVKRFSNPLFASAMYLLLSAVFGFLYGLISGAIFKRETPEF